MTPYLNLVIIFVEIWVLGGILLALHWYGKKIGLAPLFVFMGGLTGALQLQSLGWLSIQVGKYTFNLDSHTLLPVLLFGLLIIYVINGTIWARGILIGMIIVTIMAASFQVIMPFQVNLPGGLSQLDSVPGYSPRILAASAVAFTLDLIILVPVYQAASNIRGRFPSRFAGGMALLVALWSDAFVFPLIGFGFESAFSEDIITHLAGKTIAGFALIPLLTLYLQIAAPRFPDSAASIPRRTLDFFTTSMQFEAQARHHYMLLRTLSEINKLVVHSTDTKDLLKRACDLIAESRDYQLVCITKMEEEKVSILAQVSRGSYNLDELYLKEDSLCIQSSSYGQYLIIEDAKSGETVEGTWQDQVVRLGFRTVAAVPMRNSGNIHGVLNLFLTHPFAFDKTEIEIIQNLADDLAYALVSIQAREQQAILQTAAETMQDGLLISDVDGNLLYINPIVARIIGTSREEIIGRNISELLTEDQAEGFQDALKIIMKRQRVSLEVDFLSRHGRMLTISTHSALVRNENNQPQHIVINIRDITNQRQHENQLLAMNRLTTDLVQIHDIGTLLENALKISEEMLNADSSLIYIYEPGKQRVLYSRANKIPAGFLKGVLENTDEFPIFSAFSEIEPRQVEDTRSNLVYGDRLAFLADDGVRSIITFPIIQNDTPIGALVTGYSQTQSFNDDFCDLGMTLTQTLAIILNNAQLYQQSLQSMDEMAALVTGTQSLSTTLEYTKILRVITEQLTKAFDIQACSISGYNPENGTLQMLVEFGPDDWGIDEFWYEPAPSGDFPRSKEVLETNTACQLRINDLDLDPAEREFMKRSDINFLLMVPLITQEETIGLIELMDDRMDKIISESQMVLIQSLASQAAIAIQNARLYEAEQHQRQLADALILAAGSLNSTLDLEEVFDAILDQVMEVVTCQAANIMMVEGDYGFVRRYRGYGDVPEYITTMESLRLPITTPSLQTMLKGDLVLVSDTHSDPSWKIMEGSEWIRSYVGIPLKIDQQVVGFLNVNSEIPGYFTKETTHRLQTFADHAAIAFHNADLYRQLQDHAIDLEARVVDRTFELNAAKENIEGILSSVPDAVFVLNQENKMIQVNQAGELLLEKVKESKQDLFSPEFLTSIRENISPDTQNLLEVGDRTYQPRASRILSDKSQPTGQVIAFRDVTHFKELDQLKTQFVSDVSHELRTPLTNLTLYLGFLDNDRITANQRTYLDILKRETQRLTHLIEDLLTFSRIQLGKMGGIIQPSDINQIVQQMTVDRAVLAAKNEISLDYTPLGDLPNAMVDMNWFSQALSNLLTNAINYTPEGGKVVLETLVKARRKRNWVVVNVIDNGVGITEKEVPLIFDRFYRGSASQKTGAEGTGLGLAISKELVTQMGGDITFTSEVDKGSTFTIWLRPAVTTML